MSYSNLKIKQKVLGFNLFSFFFLIAVVFVVIRHQKIINNVLGGLIFLGVKSAELKQLDQCSCVVRVTSIWQSVCVSISR